MRFIINNLIKINKRYRNIFLVIFSAVISNLSYPEFDLFWVQFFSLIPFLYVFVTEEKLVNAFLYSVLFGVVNNGILCYWLKIFHPLAVPAVLLGFAIYFGILGLWTKYILLKLPRLRIFIIPSIWTTVEYIRSIGFLGFPWCHTSYSQWNFLPFIQVADIFGLWIISFLVVMINIVLLEIFLNIRSKKKIKIQLAALIILFIFPLIYGFIRIKYFQNRMQKCDELTIALIQPDIDPYSSWEEVKYKNLSRLTVLSERANLYDPDLIAWPESAVRDFIKYYYDNYEQLKKSDRIKKHPYLYEGLKYSENILRLSKDLKNYIFMGVPDCKKFIRNKKVVVEDYNSAILIDPEGQIVDVYHKIRLVPFGEWFPYNIGFVKKILAQTWAGNWTPGKNYTIFKILKNNKEYRFAGLICYEGVFGDLCRKFILKGAEFFINITNDAWSYTRRAELQHMIADVFRAIENRVPYVRSANSGATAAINQFGKVTSLFPLFKEGYIIDKIYIDKKRKLTFYSRYGDFFPKFLLIFNFLLLLFALYKRIGISANS